MTDHASPLRAAAIAAALRYLGDNIRVDESGTTAGDRVPFDHRR